MTEPTQNVIMPPISQTATIRITRAENGGYIILVEADRSVREFLYAAFSNAEDLLAGLAVIYDPMIRAHIDSTGKAA